LDIKNADCLENEPRFDEKYGPSLDFCAAMTLLKYRIMMYLSGVITFDAFLLGTHARVGRGSAVRALSGHHDVLRNIRSFCLHRPNSLPPTSKLRQRRGGLQKALADVMQQLNFWLTKSEKVNSRIWKAIVNPTPLTSQPDATSYSLGSASEAQLALKNALRPWRETEGAIDFLVRRVGKNPTYDSRLDNGFEY
jgi:hypothetical protein